MELQWLRLQEYLIRKMAIKLNDMQHIPMPGHLPAHASLFKRHGRPVSITFQISSTMKEKGGKLRQIDAKKPSQVVFFCVFFW